jgi:hypothetical protein
VRELDAETLRALAQRLVDHPEQTIARLHALVEAEEDGPRPRPEVVGPRTTADVIALLNAGVVSLAEARRYLRVNDEVEASWG